MSDKTIPIRNILVRLIEDIDSAEDVDREIDSAVRSILARVNYASCWPATEDVAAKVLDMPVTGDSRSDFEWVRFWCGDLALVLWPRGEGYFALELDVESDFRLAEIDGEVR